MTLSDPEGPRCVAVLRDQIHAVTNRVQRLVAQPGAGVLPVMVRFPSAGSSDVISPVQVLHVLQAAVDRLVNVLDSLDADGWDIRGVWADTGQTFIVYDLPLLPLHFSHRHIAPRTADRAARPSW
jgi:hypothetical protein